MILRWVRRSPQTEARGAPRAAMRALPVATGRASEVCHIPGFGFSNPTLHTGRQVDPRRTPSCRSAAFPQVEGP